MSSEFEAAGGLVTAGLVASQVEGGAAGPKLHPAHESHGVCRNCGAALGGAFCQVCGQSAHIHRSLLHLGEELLHGLLHFDAKGWRSLLTRRYIDGQRARHVSPLALFLFMVFLMFFVFSLTSVQPVVMPGGAANRAELSDNLKQADKDVAEAEADLAEAKKNGEPTSAAESQLADARLEQRVAQKALQALDERPPAAAGGVSGAASGVASPALPAPAVEEGGDWTAGFQHMDTGSKRLDEGIKHALKNPELTLYKLKGAASKFSFMLVPISLPFLWLMFFWRGGIRLYDHAVFSLYSLSFMALLAVAAALLEMAHAGGLVVFLVLALPPLHMFLQLRETYGLSIFSTLWRTVALLGVAALVFLLFLLFIVAMTMH
jgi:hypothetical protein